MTPCDLNAIRERASIDGSTALQTHVNSLIAEVEAWRLRDDLIKYQLSVAKDTVTTLRVRLDKARVFLRICNGESEIFAGRYGLAELFQQTLAELEKP